MSYTIDKAREEVKRDGIPEYFTGQAEVALEAVGHVQIMVGDLHSKACAEEMGLVHDEHHPEACPDWLVYVRPAPKEEYTRERIVISTNFRGMHGIWPDRPGTNTPVCFFSYDPDGPQKGPCDNWKANAKRMVDCWNTFLDIEDPAVLLEQRDRLLKVAKVLLESSSFFSNAISIDCVSTDVNGLEIKEELEAAIAMTEGGE